MRLAFQAFAIVLACLLWVGGVLARARAEDVVPVSNDYVLRVWELEDGMPDHHVSSIARSDDGYLWLTTFSGMLRFDGVRFQLMGKSELPGLPSPWVTPVFAASDDSLWLGLDQGGMARWDHHGAVQSVLPVQPRPTSASWSTSFAEDGAGGVWFGSGTEARVFRVKAGVVTSFAVAEGVPPGGPVLVCSSGNGTIWCCTDAGIARFDGETFVAVDGVGAGEKRIAKRAAGGVWAISGMNIRAYSEEGAISVDANINVADATNCLLEDHDGALWIGTRSSGLYHFKNGSLQRVPTSIATISALAEDDQGTLWVGTWGGGLNRLTPRRIFLHEPQLARMEDPGLVSISAGSEGKLWVVNKYAVPAMQQSTPGDLFEVPPGWQPRDRAGVVLADPTGGVWIGASTGLFRWKAGVISAEPVHAYVRALLADNQDGLWVATARDGVLRRGPDGYRRLSENSGDMDVRALAKDAAGRLWFGTRDGRVFFSQGGRQTPVALPDAELDWTVRFFVPDGDDVWIGSLLGGLYRWRDGEAIRLPADPGLPVAEIRSLVIQPVRGPGEQDASADDEFWIGTAQGLFSTARREIVRRLAGEETEIAAKYHGSNEGVPSLEFTPGGPGGVVKTADGHLWFATNRGLLEVRPAARERRGGPHKVIIEGVRLDKSTGVRNRAGALDLPPKPGMLRIRYTLPDLVAPEEVRFRYRLGNGNGGDWNMVGADREATFTELGPGRYRFEVAAALGSDSWLPETAALIFTVRPMWWQTLYFKMALFVALVAAVWGVVMLRARAKIRRLTQERAVERERTRIARDMHDELGAQLTHIATASRLAQLDEPAGAAEHLNEIASTARQTVDKLDEIVWAVNPRYDSLAGTVEYLGKYALRFVSSTGFECELDLPQEIPDLPLAADVRHHLLLVVKEALNNAVKHSLGTRISMHVAIVGESLEVVVEDNGMGFSGEAAVPGSDGLLNMRERMAVIGGSVDFRKSGAPGGLVALKLPLTGHSRKR